MAITIGSSFHLAAAVPIDDRFTVVDNTARDALAAGVRYEGLIVYSVGAATCYQLVGGIANANWAAIGGTTTVLDSAETLLNHGLSVTLAAGVVTIALKTKAGTDPSATDPVKVAFGNATVTTGDYALRTIVAALSTTIVATDTGGIQSGVMGRIHIFLIDNAGTVEICWAGSNYFGENDLVNVIAGGGASTLYNVMYGTTARSNVRFRYIGYFESTQATAGTWATNPSKIGLYPHSYQKGFATYKYDTSNGFGSTNTAIRKYSNATSSADVGGLLTVSNSSTNGFSVTANRRCRIFIMSSDQGNQAMVFGISKNSANLTTQWPSITPSERLAGSCSPAANFPGFVHVTDIAKPGDVYRPHNEADTVGGTPAYTQITIFAEEL